MVESSLAMTFLVVFSSDRNMSLVVSHDLDVVVVATLVERCWSRKLSYNHHVVVVVGDERDASGECESSF